MLAAPDEHGAGGTIRRAGRLAQLVERLPYKQEGTGSSPVPPIGESPGAIGASSYMRSSAASSNRGMPDRA